LNGQPIVKIVNIDLLIYDIKLHIIENSDMSIIVVKKLYNIKMIKKFEDIEA